MDPEWSAFTWKSEGIVDPKELESAKRDLDPIIFAQEYEASFVNFSGRAYYAFETAVHARELPYSNKHGIGFCFDFNTSPGVAVVTQEMMIDGEEVLGVIGEVFIPRASRTELVCNRLIQDWGHHRYGVKIYGDATGGAKKSSGNDGSDWDIVRSILKPHFSPMFSWKVPASNPPERARINAVNARFRTTDGKVHFLVDPVRAPKTVRDFESVVTVEGGSGELLKEHGSELTHLSDAVGYQVAYEWPLKKHATAAETW